MRGRALECAAQHQEFADETVQQRQPDGRQHCQQEERGIDRHGRCQSAKLFEFVCVLALIEHAGQHEECAGRDAMVQHLVDRAVCADRE